MRIFLTLLSLAISVFFCVVAWKVVATIAVALFLFGLLVSESEPVLGWKVSRS